MKNKIIIVFTTFTLAIFSSVTKSAVNCALLMNSNVPESQGECSKNAGEFGGSSERTDNRIYMGFAWSLENNQDLMPDLVLGFRSLAVKSNDDVNGADFNVRIKYENGISLDSLRLSYVGGERNFLGNIGGGYSLSSNTPFISVAAQASNVRAGVDYLFNQKSFTPYFELNTLNKINKERAQSSASCPNGSSLQTVKYLSGDNPQTIEPGILSIDPQISRGDNVCYTEIDL